MAQRIKSIQFKGEKTLIKFHSAEQKRGYNEIVEETNTKTSDQIRHKKFTEAFEAITPNLAIALGFETHLDTTSVPFDMGFFTKGEWKDNPRFKNLKLTGIIVSGKEAVDGIILVGTIETPSKELAPLRTPPISLIKAPDGSYTYSCILELDALWDSVETHARDFLKGVTGATHVQASLNLDDKKTVQVPQADTRAKKVIAAAGVPMIN